MHVRLLAILLALPICPAAAHDWYTGKVDPVTRIGCCGDMDCRAIEDGDVRELADGSYVYLPRYWRVPAARVQSSPDFRFHICESALFNENASTLEWRWVCFFAPPRMM
ncbi:hypothetical protein MesoLjLc_36290 [Mesorhizobium sp. L-8-10]|uniref:hypothetical protein n=1 Tax=unclassified Mesorhizobium TaxID=325217 RepID=UPI001926005F|nr:MULTISPECIES: hypothetical protein [unclassified Mesorhizobium]BCH23960.1 hypothetical protein MesoLjLb_37450 [Mesorhizobium sp. L-8-3]BCH31699.1 hypothetical protein MesoLjLc_36290 [Mesorhizobium sp. L-8-10]